MTNFNTGKLKVKYNNKIVGYLVKINENEIAFQYDDVWIETGFSISPFSLPLINKTFINHKSNFEGLYGVFWDALPDGWGELLTRRLLSKKNISFEKLSPLDKLSIISKAGLGALEFEISYDLTDYNNSSNDLDKLNNEVQMILNDNNDINILDEVYHYGGSSGGARPKVHLNINNEEWIIKFPSSMDPVDIGKKEYEANLLAAKCGINVNEFKLFKSNECSGYFGTKRFDRIDNKKIHMISLCALLETSHRIPNLDYGILFKVINCICKDKENLYEAFKRMCFNVYYKNKDDHGKNFSFLYDEENKTYTLSPFYDITQTSNKFEHEMTVNGNGNPTDDDILTLAHEVDLDLKRCIEIISNIKDVLNVK